MVPGTRFVSFGASRVASTVATPMARLRQSHSQGEMVADHQFVSSATPTNFGIWLPMMMSPTPER